VNERLAGVVTLIREESRRKSTRPSIFGMLCDRKMRRKVSVASSWFRIVEVCTRDAGLAASFGWSCRIEPCCTASLRAGDRYLSFSSSGPHTCRKSKPLCFSFLLSSRINVTNAR